MLVILTLLMMVIVAYSHFREGLFTAAMTAINVVLAGLVAFNFWEPLADMLDSMVQKTLLEGHEDFLVMLILFAGSLMALRSVTNNLANTEIEFPPLLQQLGAGAIGLLTGYLVAGFLTCLAQTLPWQDHFLGYSIEETGTRNYFPPDRVWLTLMRHAGAYPLAWKDNGEVGKPPVDRYQTFDRDGTFELRYLRYRRLGEKRGKLPYMGEFNKELYKSP